MGLGLKRLKTIGASLALGLIATSPAYAEDNDPAQLNAAFDSTFGTQPRAIERYEAVYETGLEQQIARLASGENGRIGVYAIDLTTGEEVGILADQRFPMASTSKVAIAATYLAGVDAGRWSLTSEWKLPRPGGAYVPADRLLELMIAKSCNDCTDALLSAVGGPTAVNAWMRGAGLTDFRLDRDIATLIREDGDVDPATRIDHRDSATPKVMARLLAGVHQGHWLSASSRRVLLNAMAATTTGKNRMPSALPMHANLAHKTGTLSRTASDIGIFYTPDGRAIAAAIYVTGQSPSLAVENGSRSEKLAARRQRDARIASITGALYNGFATRRSNGRVFADAAYGGE